MADISYSWTENTYYDNDSLEMDNSQVKQKYKIKSFILKFLVIFFVIALIAETIFYLIVLPATSSALVKVSGINKLSSLEIKKIAGLENDIKWLRIDSSILSKRLVSCPLISMARVEKKFPDKVLITVKEREAVAMIFTNIDNKTVAMEVDKYGVIFRLNSANISKKLPIITGLTFNNPKPGMRVNPKLYDLFIQLDVLQKKESRLLNEVSEIKIKPKKYGNFDLIIYPIRSRLSVLTNKLLTEDSLRYMLLLIDVVKDIGLEEDITQIDIRGSNAVYKKKGAFDE